MVHCGHIIRPILLAQHRPIGRPPGHSLQNPSATPPAAARELSRISSISDEWLREGSSNVPWEQGPSVAVNLETDSDGGHGPCWEQTDDGSTKA
uniref:Uncharacterized protein n=1 Tax=Arundo donax TaxID=35708 RepID=A0A0A9G6B1_ARUDO